MRQALVAWKVKQLLRRREVLNSARASSEGLKGETIRLRGSRGTSNSRVMLSKCVTSKQI